VRDIEKGAGCACALKIDRLRGKANRTALERFLGINPEQAAGPSLPPPSEAFVEVSRRVNPRLILAPTALRQADAVSQARLPLATRAAYALADWAEKGGVVGETMSSYFKRLAGVEFAETGPVGYSYQAFFGEMEVHCEYTKWHLLSGKRTNRDNALRIHFLRFEFKDTVYVPVFFCGPHPNDGDYKAKVDIPAQG